MECGREPGGKNAEELGACPAVGDRSFNGINSGKCGGRFCWAVTGTLCGGKIQGSFAEKRDTCINCDFYKRVQAEEGTANLRTKFLRFITPQGSLLNSLGFKYIKKGTRFIKQGEIGNEAYVIQRGACMEIVEKNGTLYPVGHRGEGDIVGMISLLTEEPRTMHVEAETDMDVWVIHRDQFKEISINDPDLNTFLTELIADRFDSKRPTAERTIGKYIATEIIGRGGYSIVYKGLHTTLKMPVAIKMMRHDLAMQPEFLESFHNEAKVIASLNHENIIKVFDIEERYRTVFIIMEYLEGESLKAMLKGLRTIPSQLAASYIYQICSALEYANQKNLVHRDINPSNVIVLHNDRIKLIDFGLACPTGTDDCYFGGALPYQSPELIDGEPPDIRSDIYSLGITAFELITGSSPFPIDNNRGIMDMIRNEDIPDPMDLVPDIPVLLRDFIIKACQRNPLNRFQDMRQAMEVINPLLLSKRPETDFSESLAQNQVSIQLSYDLKYQQEYISLMTHLRDKINALGGHISFEEDPFNKK